MEVNSMEATARLSDIFARRAAGAVPGARAVPDLADALDVVRRLGGAIASEIRTAPGVGSWAFITDRDGSELVLWQSARSNAAQV
jgi:predicted enzyme related to lactoylglutathione lyase